MSKVFSYGSYGRDCGRVLILPFPLVYHRTLKIDPRGEYTSLIIIFPYLLPASETNFTFLLQAAIVANAYNA